MSRKPRILSENIFNGIQFPGYTITANEEAVDHEAWRVGTYRRGERNYWTPTTANAQAWLKVDCGAARYVDTIVLDRGHNLAGASIQFQRSLDNSTWVSLVNVTVPSTTNTNDDLSLVPGVRTEEGAWCMTFTPATYRYWRLVIQAMGAGIKPQIRGLYAGLGFVPAYYFDLPYEDEGGDTFVDDPVLSEAAWEGTPKISHRRTGRISLRLSSAAEYTTARQYIRDNILKTRRPFWCWFDQEYAERAVLAKFVGGEYQFGPQPGWFHRQTSFRWTEHEPA